ncbi:VCBS repeat-containing protein, partial [Bradyrhizobium sp. NBAIM08]|uniref:FG-GAP repeat domain-containing protein n=1 Tax=Bradyrhizobium sp. NBAIM08 TaxID=2793815 RepID=UPI001CD19BBC
GLAALDVADYDGDGVDEAFLSTASLYDGYLATYDFSASATEWQSPLNYASAVAATHADMTGDGAADFVVIGGDGKISVVDPLHSTSVWQSTTLNNGVDIGAADINQDGRPELIALTGGFLYVYGNTAWGAPFTQSA